jgi:hypothetical protein
MMKKAVSSGLTNPLTLNRLINIGVDNVSLDRAMSTKDIATVARRFRSLDPDTVDMRTLPTVGDTIGGAAVQLLDEQEAQDDIDLLKGMAPAGPVRPGDVQVRVLNGNGGDGTAAKTAFALQHVGFSISGKGDADSFSYRKSVIRYAPNRKAQAELLRSYLASGATLEEDDTLGAVDVALVVGADFTGVRPGPAADAAPQTPEATPDTTTVRKPAC